MRHYPSKLLLFGEHILLLGARALAVPVPAFGGHWAWRAAGAPADIWAPRMQAFAASEQLAAVAGLEVARFQTDLNNGLFFESTIPAGYGLGSSGALCAAVYDRYAAQKTTDLARLKADFAGMESFFHGQSSGIDPLTIYLNRALWIDNRTEVSYVDPQPWTPAAPVVFLLDSHLPRQTGPLVQWFLEQSRAPAFARLLEQQLFPAHEAVLKAWQNGDGENFWPALQQVSTFQFEHFPPMIPATVRDVWKTCLTETGVLLKICGAGGGGFVLGFAAEKNAVIEKFGTFAPVFPFEQHDVVEK